MGFLRLCCSNCTTLIFLEFVQFFFCQNQTAYFLVRTAQLNKHKANRLLSDAPNGFVIEFKSFFQNFAVNVGTFRATRRPTRSALVILRSKSA